MLERIKRIDSLVSEYHAALKREAETAPDDIRELLEELRDDALAARDRLRHELYRKAN